jgi:hypothetical protein
MKNSAKAGEIKLTEIAGFDRILLFYFSILNLIKINYF